MLSLDKKPRFPHRLLSKEALPILLFLFLMASTTSLAILLLRITAWRREGDVPFINVCALKLLNAN